jgi:hypothetical protein
MMKITTGASRSTASGASPRSAPVEVATPRPPVKRMKTDQM